LRWIRGPVAVRAGLARRRAGRPGGAALAKTGIVFYDYQEQRVTDIPARFRALLQRVDGER